MAEKPAMAIFTIVAVIAIVGLVLVFSGAGTGGYAGGGDKLYGGGAYIPGGEGTYDRYVKSSTDVPTYTGPRIAGIRHSEPFASESPTTVHQRISPYKTASESTNPCYPGKIARDKRYADYSVQRNGDIVDCTYAHSLDTA